MKETHNTASNDIAPNEQYALLSVEDCFAELDSHQKRVIRSSLARLAMACMEQVTTLTEMLVADGEEPKSRRKPFTLPAHIVEIEA